MDDETTGPAPADLPALRLDRLRRTAPAVQHEINNALMVLASNLELLGRSVADGAPRRQLDRALEAVRRLDETSRGFLDAARRDTTDIAEAPPGALLRQVAPLLRVTLGARHGLDIEADPAGPAVRLDRGRLDLALLSLAREAAGRMANGARIAAWVQPLPESGEVMLGLTLPPGAEPGPETIALLTGAATATGGRLERTADGLALVWPRPA